MVEIFACATALLSPDFVEGFEPETLASKFIKVEKEYRVKFQKTETSFNITGHWKAVRDAHSSLLQLKAANKSSCLVLPESPVDGCRKDLLAQPAVQTPNPSTSQELRSQTVHDTDHIESEVGNIISTSIVDPVCQMKGNPKRGRHAADRNKTSQVPEPFVYIHYQDESFTSETSVDMDKVLDEFEKGQTQSNNTVTKEDLKKILDKNTDQMGRPLHKHLPKSAAPPNNQKTQTDNTPGNQSVHKSLSETVSQTLISAQQGNPETLSNMYDGMTLGDQTQVSWTNTMDQVQQGVITMPNYKTTDRHTQPSERNMSDVTSFLPSSGNLNAVKGLSSRGIDTSEMSHYSMYSTPRSAGNPSFENILYTTKVQSLSNKHAEITEALERITHQTRESYSHGSEVILVSKTDSYTKLVDAQNIGPQDQSYNLSSRFDGELAGETSIEMQNTSISMETSHAGPMGMCQEENVESIQSQENTGLINPVNVTDKDIQKNSTQLNDTGREMNESCVPDCQAMGTTKKSPQKGNKQKKATKVKTQSRKVKQPKKKLTDDRQEVQLKEASLVVQPGENVQGVAKSDDERQDSEVKDKTTGTKKSEPIYKCTDCDYQGRRKKRLTEHMGRVHGLLTENCRGSQEQTLFPCELCDKSFVFGKDLNRHKKIVHHGNRYYCKLCNKLYKSKYVYDRHMATHVEGYVQPMFKCQICVKEFTTKFSLGCHIKSEHLGLKKTYICPICGKSFSQIRSYRQHANVHAGIRPYVCEICGKSFTYDKSLKEHRYMHDDIRRFPCSICDKAFRQRTCLLIHMKVHKASKDHICSSCGKGFTQKQSLIRHERIHTGHKPYLCKLCAKPFSDYAVIRKHLLMSHKKDKIDWKEFVISEEKKMSDHYIVGGPGYVRRESSDAIRERNQAIVIPAVLPGGKPIIIENKQNKPIYDQLMTGADIDKTNFTTDLTQRQGSSGKDFAVSQSDIESPGYQVVLYTNTDTSTIQADMDTNLKHQTEVSQTNSSIGYPTNYSALHNMANSTFVLSGHSGGTTNQLNITDENILSAFNSQLLAPLTGVTAANLQPDARGLGLTNPSVLSALTAVPNLAQTSLLNLGQPSSTVPVTTQSVDQIPSNMSVTAATLSALGFPGYQTLFNAHNLNEYQQHE